LNIAQAYIGLGDFESSGELINEMKDDPILESFVREKSQFNILKGSWYSEQKLYREAFESLTYAKELVESYNDVYLLKEIQEERCRLCELMNDIPVGYMVQKEYISLLNEVSNRELALAALKLDIKHGISDIEKKANTDYLTGLYNRSYLENTTNNWLEQASEKNENIVCIAFDIDNFKPINDEYGHLFGDEVIKQVSKACSKIFKENDLIGRYGGDEFVVILKGASLECGIKKAEEIGATLENYQISKDGKSVSITASIGVADNSSGTVNNFNELFHLADVGLFKAKQNGKNQIYVWR
jgi:diguanylate cyclase (GGDEF)-like protein